MKRKYFIVSLAILGVLLLAVGLVMAQDSGTDSIISDLTANHAEFEELQGPL